MISADLDTFKAGYTVVLQMRTHAMEKHRRIDKSKAVARTVNEWTLKVASD